MVEEGADPNPVDRHQRTPLEVRRFAHAALPLKHAWPVHILKPVFACSLQEAARNDHTEVVKVLLSKDARICEDGQLLELEKSKLHGVCNMRRHMLTELGWDPEWEVNPKEVKLIETIGEGGGRRAEGRKLVLLPCSMESTLFHIGGCRKWRVWRCVSGEVAWQLCCCQDSQAL